MAQGLIVSFYNEKTLCIYKTSTKIIMILSLIHGEQS